MSDIQNGPVEDGAGDAGDDDRIDGVVELLRGDIALGHVNDPRAELAQRLSAAGIQVDADELEGLLAGL
jgi:hypothetical protein